MKKYKLKKWYPSLPKDWEEGMEVGISDREWSYGPCNSKYTQSVIYLMTQVQDNPEFWEEVVQPNYQILSFLSSWNGLAYRQKDGTYLYDVKDMSDGASLEWMLEDDIHYIHSVKRLSDEEVFTIGDKYENLSGVFTIKSFGVSGDVIVVKSAECGACELEYIHKVKPSKEFPLDFSDLKGGKFYTTYYEGQGTSTFKMPSFTPDIGFTSFREATDEEILNYAKSDI